MHDQLQVGTVLDIGAPRNLFELAPSAPHHLLLAGGIGITPLLAMAEQLAVQGGGFTLRLSDDLAVRNALVSVGDEGTERRMHFATMNELAEAIVDIALVDTFSDELGLAVSWSAESLADARITLQNAQTQSIRRDAPGGRPARSTQKFARHSGPTNVVERTVELEEDTQVDALAGTASGIDMEPHAAKKPARPAQKSGARFTGTLGEGGDVTVKLTVPDCAKLASAARARSANALGPSSGRRMPSSCTARPSFRTNAPSRSTPAMRAWAISTLPAQSGMKRSFGSWADAA